MANPSEHGSRMHPPPLTNQHLAANRATVPVALAQSFPTNPQLPTTNYALPINYNQNYQMQPNINPYQSIHIQESNGVVPQHCHPNPPRQSHPQMASFSNAALPASTTSSVTDRSPSSRPPSLVNAYTPPPLQFDASSILTGCSTVTF